MGGCRNCRIVGVIYRGLSRKAAEIEADIRRKRSFEDQVLDDPWLLPTKVPFH